MKEKFSHLLLNSLSILGLFALLLGIVYPLFILGLGYVVFPSQAKGSMIRNKNQKIIGSRLIGQNFQSDKYFHPRPSHAGTTGYDAASSNGSYAGPSSEQLYNEVSSQVAQYRRVNQLSDTMLIPADAIFSSGSGLDPHISVTNAKLQAERIAGARNLSSATLDKLIEKYAQTSVFTSSHMSYVNVLLLNLALDEMEPSNIR